MIAVLLVLVLAFLVVGGIIAITSPPDACADPPGDHREPALQAPLNVLATLTALLAREGFIAAAEEAEELLAFAAGDPALLDTSVRRRLTGEPLAWITGAVTSVTSRCTSIPASTCLDG